MGDAVAHGACAKHRNSLDRIKRHFFSPRKHNKKNILGGNRSSS
jgi:hypothetical protein